MARKDKNILVRMTEEESNEVKKKAQELGLSVSDYIRLASAHCVIEIKVKTKKEKEI